MAAVQDLPAPQLNMAEAEAQRRFEQLQAKLVPMWKDMRAMTSTERTIVVVPSQTVEFDVKGAEMQSLEERYLFLLLLLRQPRVRMIYVTSQTILPSTIDYYLGLIPGIVIGHARQRLFNVAPEDRSPRPLSLKLLERPNIIRDIRALIPDPDNAHLVTYNSTMLERDLALMLGIPIYGADPKFFPLGSKTGCRRLFAEEDVVFPIGREDLASIEEVGDAIRDMRREKPTLQEVMVKQNDGISGEGNAVVSLAGLPAPGSAEEDAAVAERVAGMQLEYPGLAFEDYAAKFAADHGIVEERIVGEEIRSPSVQLRVTPLGEVQLLSTHDQLLGGATKQLYLGARFPADTAYAALISREAMKVGKRLAQEGVLGRFAVDFVVVRRPDGSWEPFAIELNLRKGGTTHPFLTLEYLTDGVYNAETGVFLTPSGQEKHLVASDHMESPLFRLFNPDSLMDIAIRRGLHFDHTRQTGVIFHMMASMAENGRIGATAIANSPDEADELYQKFEDLLLSEAHEALQPVAIAED